MQFSVIFCVTCSLARSSAACGTGKRTLQPPSVRQPGCRPAQPQAHVNAYEPLQSPATDPGSRPRLAKTLSPPPCCCRVPDLDCPTPRPVSAESAASAHSHCRLSVAARSTPRRPPRWAAPRARPVCPARSRTELFCCSAQGPHPLLSNADSPASWSCLSSGTLRSECSRTRPR